MIGAAWLVVLLLLESACGSAQQSIEEIEFHSGEFDLVGDLRLPGGAGPYPVVVFVHGDGPNNRTSGATYPPLMDRMLEVGYATFAWDKPGTGESTGQIDRSRLMEQRAQIVLDAIEVLKARSDIDPEQIGLCVFREVIKGFDFRNILRPARRLLVYRVTFIQHVQVRREFSDAFPFVFIGVTDF